MNPLIQRKTIIVPLLIGLAVACFVLPAPGGDLPDPPPPRGEDRFNGNSAAEDVDALNLATTGENNTAHGWFSLFSNIQGFENTADGVQALYNNTTGGDNTATGFQGLFFNTGGDGNTAIGAFALSANITGTGNNAFGYGALWSSITGDFNTALGAFAGDNVITASRVICIGSLGANVSNTTWIDNVYGVTTQSSTTAPVVVSDTGQLGTVASSERFKRDIATMEKASEAILLLRPVTFHYKSDVKAAPQFGLIAEEVAKVNPALVLPDKEGKPYTVRYDAVNAMLLNEFLKEHRLVQEQGAMIARQQKQIESLTAGLQKVSARLEASKPAPQMVANNK
jgi:hypothetical protein